MDAKLIHRRSIHLARLQLWMFDRIAIHAVVAEGGEAEQDVDVLRVRVVDQLAKKTLAHVRVLGIVLPRDRKLTRAEATGGPQNQRVYVILSEAIDRLFPLGEAHHGHAHERDVITT